MMDSIHYNKAAFQQTLLCVQYIEFVLTFYIINEHSIYK